MKKILFVLALAVVPFIISAVPPKAELKAEKPGDKYYLLRNTITQTAAALVNINLAIGPYRKAFEADKSNPAALFDYFMAADFKYTYLEAPVREQKDFYDAFIKEIGPFGEKLSGTKEYNCVMALAWGRKGEMTANVMEAANEGVADKVKNYAEALYGIDRAFDGYVAGIILGRLHYKAPNIIFILTWPDKNKSKVYLEEYLKANPGSLDGKIFLADTIWDIGDREIAKKLYREVMASKPAVNGWFRDSRAISLCADRMKELQIQ